ncbi:MAG: hypothetical protein KDC71_18070 [Acidobacteria bacterium]|nr:hypothetical protein [Acidobacteriota bacterium]
MRALAFCLLSTVLWSQNIEIPDVFFKACLVSSYDQNGDGEISMAEAAAIEEIHCTARDIQTLEGIQNMTQVKVLDVDQNALQTVQQIQGLTQLEVLELGENQIESLPDLANHTQLTYLYCSTNRLTQLPNLPTSLKTLLGSGNGLTSLPALPSGLEALRVSYNNLVQPPDLSQMPNLKSLSLGFNPLSGLPNLTGLIQLEYLEIEGLGLTSIPELSGFPNLTGLYIGDNPLNQLPDFSNLDLVYLGLGNLNLTSMPDLSQQTRLDTLYLNENQIADVQGLAPLTKISFLHLGDNQITELPPMGDFQNMCCLFVQNNGIQEIPAGLDTLDRLQLFFIQNNNLDYGDCADILAFADKPGLTFVHNPQKSGEIDCRKLGDTQAVIPWVVQNSQYTSRISIFNASTTDTSAQLVAVTRSGDRLEKVVELPAQRVFASSSETLFGSASGYALYIMAPTEMVYASFLTFNRQSASGMSPAQTIAARPETWGSDLLFAYIPGDMVPALVLVAPEVAEGVTTLTCNLFSDSMEPIAVNLDLNANQPKAILVTDLFGLQALPAAGSVRVQAPNQIKITGTTFVFNQFLEPSMSVPYRLNP